ncbi:glycosyltransferase [Cyclobacterium sp. 1_MG-2023]|uniref:glycosyltransferase n=1 Tax=Cyclobacterium sp. 1_MG-2023 TaxID=3062681 RepID=UPI0026E22F1D|nr:glycosyltransferase [Cyclobacterium sp. 1_MG-2023]MDO6440380.1 glycosyltransferase [Cyclobacterium sp. 1_MG-2023]
MSQLRLLISYDYFTPAYKAGGPIRSIDNLVQLLGNEISIFIITSNQDHDGTVLDVPSNSWVQYTDNCSVIYLDSSSRNYKSIKMVLNEIHIDLIYINGIFSLFSTINLLRFSKKEKIKVLIASRGMLQQGALAIKSVKKKLFLFFLNRFFIKNNPLVSWHATDEQESLDIHENFGNNQVVSIIGNVPLFTNDKSSFLDYSESVRFITISLIAPKKNHIWFIESLKRISFSDKSIIYDIYGPANKEYLDLILLAAKDLPDNVSVNIFPALSPNQVQSTLKRYHYFVLPTFGENFGHAIFESFNSSRPVLISDKTPWRNLVDKNAGWDLPLNHKVWDETLTEILEMESKQYDLLCKGARTIAIHYIESKNLKVQYLKMFNTVNNSC